MEPRSAYAPIVFSVKPATCVDSQNTLHWLQIVAHTARAQFLIEPYSNATREC